jgi:hypothetical protein
MFCQFFKATIAHAHLGPVVVLNGLQKRFGKYF